MDHNEKTSTTYIYLSNYKITTRSNTTQYYTLVVLCAFDETFRPRHTPLTACVIHPLLGVHGCRPGQLSDLTAEVSSASLQRVAFRDCGGRWSRKNSTLGPLAPTGCCSLKKPGWDWLLWRIVSFGTTQCRDQGCPLLQHAWSSTMLMLLHSWTTVSLGTAPCSD